MHEGTLSSFRDFDCNSETLRAHIVNCGLAKFLNLLHTPCLVSVGQFSRTAMVVNKTLVNKSMTSFALLSSKATNFQAPRDS